MLLKKLIYSSILLCATLCCPEDDIEDCSLVDCMSVDNSVYVKFLDSASGENLITNGSFQVSQIAISDSDTSPVDFEVQKDFENEDVLILDLQNADIGEQSYQIMLGDTTSFNFALTTFSDAGSVCCGPYTGIDDVSLSGIEGDYINRGILPIEVSVFVP
ncbi:hypothetical protein FVB32_08565 [Flagellimonas hymeniacidonis]|uniref:Uncharacterized protein n=1 Tax=Flagellimonas hymeniacidonis TaxID=2603628 RepID=A0A5C8V9F5_9FLAO|nr:hypothetical protein [Flagellimonas hymeniacidonis]TXN38331.1 hypothetical protein FVB32_08565 [Flagellimonas hymeniacidonis]